MSEYTVTDSTLPAELDMAQSEAISVIWGVQWVFPIATSGVNQVNPGRELVLGRDPDADVVLDDQLASRTHAKVSCCGNELRLFDTNSRNGTFVNGSRIARTKLKHGDVIRVGGRIGVITHGPQSHLVAPAVSRVADGLWAGPKLQRVLESLSALACTNLPIVVEGQTGTGKERVARAIHQLSGRRGPFVGINCAAIPENLAEAQLFGYRKGAFTGAERAAVGHLQAASGGTLLLDEVCDLPLALQAKLLRVLEENEVQQLGDPRPTPIDVRIVTAARSPLADLVNDGRCRSDFAARLSGAIISLPCLRDRKEELPSLFLQLLSASLGSSPPEIEAELMERLLLHRWPGNVRELDLLSRRLLGLHGHQGKLRVAHLAGTALEKASSCEEPDEGLSPDERDSQRLIVALREHRGNLAKAATSLKLSRQRAYRLLKATNVSLDALRPKS